MGQIQGTSLYVTDNCIQSFHILPDDCFVYASCLFYIYQLVERLCLFFMCFFFLFFFFFFPLHFPYKVQTDVNVYLNLTEQISLLKIHWWTIILTFTVIEPFCGIVVLFVLRWPPTG